MNLKEIDDEQIFINLKELNNINESLNNLKNKSLDEITTFFKNLEDEKIGYDDIYYYLYYYNNKENMGKYSNKFRLLNKNKNYKNQKQLFRKRCHKYYIDDNKRLVKKSFINDPISRKATIKELILVPPKFIIKLFISHKIEKNIFRKPNIIQIVPKGPKYVYQIDLTEILIKLQTDENAKYIISIIDTFSKFGYCYILNNKRDDSVLGKIKDFINKFGKSNSIQTDNGKEFTNALLSKYCDELKIKFFHGRP